MFGSKCFPFFMLAGLLCSCQTTYHPRDKSGGYTVEQTAPDVFQVGFKGNSRTSMDRVYDFAKLRAAQTTLEHGFSFFVFADAENTSSVKERRIITPAHYTPMREPGPETMGTSSSWSFGGGEFVDPSGAMIGPAQVTESDSIKIGVLYTVKTYKTKPPGIYSYNAAEIQQALKETYGLK